MDQIRAYCKASAASDVRWGHAVNSLAKLRAAIAAAAATSVSAAATAAFTASTASAAAYHPDSIHMIEVDLCVKPSDSKACVVSHDPTDQADLFEEWLREVCALQLPLSCAVAQLFFCCVVSGYAGAGAQCTCRQQRVAANGPQTRCEAAQSADRCSQGCERAVGAGFEGGAKEIDAQRCGPHSTLVQCRHSAWYLPSSSSSALFLESECCWFCVCECAGPNGSQPLFDGPAFIQECLVACPDPQRCVFSLGWTTGAPTPAAVQLLDALNESSAAAASAASSSATTTTSSSSPSSSSSATSAASASSPASAASSASSAPDSAAVVTGYSEAQIHAMEALCTKHQLPVVTLPVRACFLRANFSKLWAPLLSRHPLWSLTVWTGAQDKGFDRKWLQQLALDWPNQVFLDLPLTVHERSAATPAAAASGSAALPCS
jgi:hypothetical protein